MHDESSTKLQSPTRGFGWPMRLLVSSIVFAIVFRSFAELSPYRDWARELKVQRFPHPLSKDEPAAGRWQSLSSTIDYFKPWPNATTRARLDTASDWEKYAWTWLSTRLELIENLTYATQGWPMFAPNVKKTGAVLRARLVFCDGSQRIVVPRTDPGDLTHYASFRFNSEKHLQYSNRPFADEDARLGYCNLLCHQHRVNDNGSPLVRIEFVRVTISYPRPDEDARRVLAAAFVAPGEERVPPFYVFEVVAQRHVKLE